MPKMSTWDNSNYTFLRWCQRCAYEVVPQMHAKIKKIFSSLHWFDCARCQFLDTDACAVSKLWFWWMPVSNYSFGCMFKTESLLWLHVRAQLLDLGEGLDPTSFFRWRYRANFLVSVHIWVQLLDVRSCLFDLDECHQSTPCYGCMFVVCSLILVPVCCLLLNLLNIRD